MAKSCNSLLIPLIELLLLLFVDACFLVVNVSGFHWWDYLQSLLFNLMCAMVIWCHLTTMLADPGFVPLGYEYQLDLMSDLDRQLYKFATLNRDADVRAEAGMSFE